MITEFSKTLNLSNSQLQEPTHKVTFSKGSWFVERGRSRASAPSPKTELLGFTTQDWGWGWGRISLVSLYRFCDDKGEKKMIHYITTAMPANSSPCVSNVGTAVCSLLHLGWAQNTTRKGLTCSPACQNWEPFQRLEKAILRLNGTHFVTLNSEFGTDLSL